MNYFSLPIKYGDNNISHHTYSFCLIDNSWTNNNKKNCEVKFAKAEFIL